MKLSRSLRAISILALIFVTGERASAKSPKPEDIAGMIAFLLRVHDGVCPRVTFDPVAMSRMIEPRGMTLEAIKRRFRKDFNESYAEAGARIASDGLPAYCEMVQLYLGRNPGEVPGLVIH